MLVVKTLLLPSVLSLLNVFIDELVNCKEFRTIFVINDNYSEKFSTNIGQNINYDLFVVNSEKDVINLNSIMQKSLKYSWGYSILILFLSHRVNIKFYLAFINHMEHVHYTILYINFFESDFKLKAAFKRQSPTLCYSKNIIQLYDNGLPVTFNYSSSQPKFGICKKLYPKHNSILNQKLNIYLVNPAPYTFNGRDRNGVYGMGGVYIYLIPIIETYLNKSVVLYDGHKSGNGSWSKYRSNIYDTDFVWPVHQVQRLARLTST